MSGKNIEYLIKTILAVIFIVICCLMAVPVEARGSEPELKLVEATAYYDYRQVGISYDGRKLVPGLTIAGRKEDIGKTALIYDMDYRLMGIYEFRDIGYGQATGNGTSRIRKGMTVGTIENGSCVDIYFGSLLECRSFGRQKVYMQIVDAKG